MKLVAAPPGELAATPPVTVDLVVWEVHIRTEVPEAVFMATVLLLRLLMVHQDAHTASVDHAS